MRKLKNRPKSWGSVRLIVLGPLYVREVFIVKIIQIMVLRKMYNMQVMNIMCI